MKYFNKILHASHIVVKSLQYLPIPKTISFCIVPASELVFALKNDQILM